MTYTSYYIVEDEIEILVDGLQLMKTKISQYLQIEPIEEISSLNRLNER